MATATIPRTPLREALDRALAAPSPQGDLRAFALGDTTCVVRWRPGLGAYFHVELRVRRGETAVEHATTVQDLGLLPRWAEHHVRTLTLDSAAEVVRRPASASRPMSPADHLRARLLARP